MTDSPTDCGEVRTGEKAAVHHWWRSTVAHRVAKRVITSIAGGVLIGLGMVMIFTPGPALVLIPAGLAVLAIEYVWAKRLLKWFKTRIVKLAGAVGGEKAAAQIDHGVNWVQRKLHINLDEDDTDHATSASSTEKSQRTGAHEPRRTKRSTRTHRHQAADLP